MRSTKQPEPRSSITGMPRARPSSASSRERHRGGEAHHAVVRGVHLQEHAGIGADGVGVVLEMGAVGGADLAQGGAGAAHDVGDAELAADLDQLAARDDDLLAAGQALEREQHGGGAVVDHEGGLRAGEAPQQPLHVRVARAALLAGHVHLEVGVRRGDLARGAPGPAATGARGRGWCAAPRRWR